MSSTALTRPPPAPAPAAAPAPRRRLLPSRLDDRVAGWVWPLLVTLFAGFLRFDRLSVPGKLVFDEVYYAKDAWSLLHHGVEIDQKTGGPGFVAHPPLGKWAIAGGEALFGNTPLGWRFSAAVAGTLSVLLLARIGRRLFRSTLLGSLAGLLLALDGLHFVQSRTSMLDIFLTVWVLAGFGCLLLDRDRTRARLAVGQRAGPRWWLLAAGVCLGAACATKWSGLYYLLAFGLLAFVWEIGARRALGAVHPVRAALRHATPPLAGGLGLAATTYVASWTGWFAANGRTAYGHDTYVAGQGPLGHAVAVVHGWLAYHAQVWHFHETLVSSHPYQSHPIGWLLLARPVSYFYAAPKFGRMGCTAKASCSKEVLAIGTPAIWWVSIAALVAVLWWWVSRRDWRAAAILVGVAAGIVPWMWNDLQRRTEFLFYALPSVPFLVLALTMCAGAVLGPRTAPLGRRAAGAGIVAAYALLVLANFVYLYPVLAAEVFPYADWHARMWFGSWI